MLPIVASGSLSLEIGGPRVDVDKTFGIPDPSWASWVLDRITRCEHDELIAQATEARMLAAGNVAGELLELDYCLGDCRCKPSSNPHQSACPW